MLLTPADRSEPLVCFAYPLLKFNILDWFWPGYGRLCEFH
eukprot:COSAG02_NODE_50928_length_310_cov_0.949541_1_plen_39_part_01